MFSGRVLVCFVVAAAAAGCSFVRDFDGFAGGRDGGGGPSEIDAGVHCPRGRVECAALRACVDPLDPDFGCGSTTCMACDGTNASSIKCVGGATGAVCRPTCLPNTLDCDGDPRTGCEADLSKAAHCGACTNACSGATPFCANVDGGFSCLNGCPNGQAACGSECVVLSSSADHCGDCATKCTAPENARATCNAGRCSFECLAGTHACGSTCASNADAKQCGTACVDCTKAPPAHTVPSCQAGACVFGCEPGWDDCDGNGSCETVGGCPVPDNGAPGN